MVTIKIRRSIPFPEKRDYFPNVVDHEMLAERMSS